MNLRVCKTLLRVLGIPNLVLAALFLVACGPQSEWQQNMQMAQAAQANAGADFCAERIPAAKQRIEKLYRSGSGEVVGAEVQDPFGGVMSVKIDTGVDDPSNADIQSGLADLVLNCGDGFDNSNCFVEVYLDGQKLGSVPPTATGQVAFRCLTAGNHNLRIVSVTDVIFDDVVRFESDTQYLARITENQNMSSSFQIYAENELPDRIAAVTPEPDRPSTVVIATPQPPATSPTRPTEPVPQDTQPTQPSDEPQAGEPMSNDELDELLRFLKRKGTDRKRLRLLGEESQRNLMTSGQAAEVVALFEDPEFRIDAAIIAYPSVVDPDKFYRVLALFDTGRDVRLLCSELRLDLQDCQPTEPDPVADPVQAPQKTLPVVEPGVVAPRSAQPVQPTTPVLAPQKPAAEQPVEAISANDFDGLLTAVEDASFSDDKIQLIKGSAATGYFTAAQAAALVSALDFSNGQEEIAVTLYPRLVDPHNFFKVLEALQFKSSRDAVNRKLGL